MSRVRENKARERRIVMQAVVDAYNESERAMSWYYYLEERLKFPFKARCKSKRAISPLRTGEEVNVLAMAPEEECESEMFVRVRWHGRSIAIPLSQLKPWGRIRRPVKPLVIGATGWRGAINSEFLIR
jgi:hypothetical protein